MECHYSCLTCSASVYLYNCLSCPATRTLLGSTCVCDNGYYERQSAQCIESATSSNIVEDYYTHFFPVANVFYIINIVAFWIYVIILFCRGSSPFSRLLINFSQISSLIAYLPFRLDEASHKFVTSLSGFNFGYLNQLLQCKSTGLPTICNGYQNVVGYFLIYAGMILAVFISSCIMSMLYASRLQFTLTFPKYLKPNIFLILFHVLDLSTVYLSLTLCRILLTSYYVFFLIFLFIAIYMIVLKKYFALINHKQQAHLEYRQRNSWAYIYDEKYHLYYIDFLYDYQNQEEEEAVDQLDNLVEEADNIFTGRREDMTKAFFPKSNLVIMEIVWKAFMGASVVLLFQQKPSLLVYPTILLLIILTCWMSAFFYYQKGLWWAYMVAGLVSIICYSLYWLKFFWGVAFGISLAFTAGFLISLVFVFGSYSRLDKKIADDLFGQTEQINQEDMYSSKNEDNNEKKQADAKISQSDDDEAERNSQEELVIFQPQKDQQFQKRKKQLMLQMQKRAKGQRDINGPDERMKDQNRASQMNRSIPQQFGGGLRPSNYQKKIKERTASALSGKRMEDNKNFKNIFDQPDQFASDKQRSALQQPSEKHINQLDKKRSENSISSSNAKFQKDSRKHTQAQIKDDKKLEQVDEKIREEQEDENQPEIMPKKSQKASRISKIEQDKLTSKFSKFSQKNLSIREKAEEKQKDKKIQE